MAQKKQTRLSTKEKLSLAQKAKQTERLGDLAKLVDSNLATKPTESWRTLTEDHKEIVLFRLAAGDTVAHVAQQMGISPGLIYMARHLDEEFAKRYALARKAGADALVDRIREIAHDDTLSDARAKLESDNLKWIAARTSRQEYGEHVQVDQNVTVQPVQMPDWVFGQVIQGQIISGDDPTEDPDADNPTE